VTAKEKSSANQNDRIILGREITTALRDQFNFIRASSMSAIPLFCSRRPVGGVSGIANDPIVASRSEPATEEPAISLAPRAPSAKR
jgi:hypothetical protein